MYRPSYIKCLGRNGPSSHIAICSKLLSSIDPCAILWPKYTNSTTSSPAQQCQIALRAELGTAQMIAYPVREAKQHDRARSGVQNLSYLGCDKSSLTAPPRACASHSMTLRSLASAVRWGGDSCPREPVSPASSGPSSSDAPSSSFLRPPATGTGQVWAHTLLPMSPKPGLMDIRCEEDASA